MSFLQVPKTALSFAQQGRSALDNLANKFIVKPKTVKGINGFIFDYEGESQISLKSDIPDHFLETNIAVNDQIAIKPLRIVLRGYVGELVLKKQDGVLGALGNIQNALTIVPAYIGKYTPSQLALIQKVITKTQTIVSQIDQALARVKNIIGFFDKSVPRETKQQKAFAQLYALWDTKQIFSVETPNAGFFDNMVIESVDFIQPEETRSYSDISVTLKQLRFVNVQYSTIDFDSGRAFMQRQAEKDNGVTKGKPDSVLFEYFYKPFFLK